MYCRNPQGHSISEGYSITPDITSIEVITSDSEAPPSPHAEFALWFEVMRYGVIHLNDYSIQARDNLFVYNRINQDNFQGIDRFVSRFTTSVTYLTQDDKLYHHAHKFTSLECEKAQIAFGNATVAANDLVGMPEPSDPTRVPANQNLDLLSVLEGFGKIIVDHGAQASPFSKREKLGNASSQAARSHFQRTARRPLNHH